MTVVIKFLELSYSLCYKSPSWDWILNFHNAGDVDWNKVNKWKLSILPKIYELENWSIFARGKKRNLTFEKENILGF